MGRRLQPREITDDEHAAVRRATDWHTRRPKL